MSRNICKSVSWEVGFASKDILYKRKQMNNLNLYRLSPLLESTDAIDTHLEIVSTMKAVNYR